MIQATLAGTTMGMQSHIESKSQDEYEETIKAKKRIMHIIADKRASYPSEISKRMDLRPDQVSSLIHDLIDDGHLEKIPVAYHDIDPRLMARVPDMWNMDVKGMSAFQKRMWVGLTEDKVLHHSDGRVTNPKGEEIDYPGEYVELRDMLGREK